MTPFELEKSAAHLGNLLIERKEWLATAESCTGGMVAAALTAIAGSSDVFDRAFVTYSNGAKTAMLGVPASLTVVPLTAIVPRLLTASTSCTGHGLATTASVTLPPLTVTCTWMVP